MKPALLAIKISPGNAAELLQVTRPRLIQMMEEGKLPPMAAGEWRLAEIVTTYVKHIRDDARRVADADLKAARQRAIEVKTAREEGRLIEASDVLATVNDVIGTFRARLNGVPAAATRDLDARTKIEGAINRALVEAESDFTRAIGDLQAGQDPLGTDQEDDA